MTPYFVSGDGGFVPNEIAHGGWGPTLGGQVVGGLLARAVEVLVTDDGLQPARFTVEILRRVASAPVRVSASVGDDPGRRAGGPRLGSVSEARHPTRR